ncbi:family 16 glycosylhydrolase [Pontiellaceae bacterium B12219]|nr:family 16 glycosylhydrolase [Pontiellaceae bacterium B12219]
MENSAYTDEFNGNELDSEKWYDHHPRWKGRPPAKFMPENVSMKDGFLRLTNGMLPETQGDFTMGGAAVVSKTAEAFYGYYECRMKASSISMSSTFWMSNRGKEIPGIGRISQELDIQETIGGAKKNKRFRTRMNSNTHVWHNQESISEGNHAELSPATDEAFHVYGCWWENATTVHFYCNGKYVGTVHPSTRYSATPFDSPMHINMVTETYNWETPPTPEEINDPAINTTLIDWVRAYTLVPAEG